MKFIKLTVVLLAMLLSTAVFANEWPNKPVRIVVTFPPGGGTDIMARNLAAQLQKIWNQPVIVENKPGANNVVGVNYVLSQPADGTTIGVAQTGIVNGFAWNTKLPYKLDDLENVGMISVMNHAYTVRADFPANNLAELIAYAKANPGKMTFGSSGIGTMTHFTMVLLEEKTGVKMLHIPFKGSIPVITEMLGGRIDMTGDAFLSTKQQVEAGKLKVIAMVGKVRTINGKTYPLASDTVPGLSVNSYYGAFVPAGTPKAIVEKINRDIYRATQTPEFQKFMAESALSSANMTPQQYDAFVRGEIKYWGKFIKDNNIQME